MELRSLEYFVAVVEEQNFTRAAARLHVVQSGVSATIKVLERELGAPLLLRNSKRVTTTDAGAVLLPKARAALDAAREAVDAVDAVRGAVRGTVRIGTISRTGNLDLPAVLGRFHEEHPDVALQVISRPAGSRDLVAAVADGHMDVAIVSQPGPTLRGLTQHRLLIEPMRVLVPASHRLAGRQRVAIAMLADEDFVDLRPGYGSREVVDLAFSNARVSRHITVEVSDVSSVADYVRHGLGIALIPRFAVPTHPRLRSLDLSGATLSWPMSAVVSSRRPASAATRTVLDMLRAAPVTGAG